MKNAERIYHAPPYSLLLSALRDSYDYFEVLRLYYS